MKQYTNRTPQITNRQEKCFTFVQNSLLSTTVSVETNCIWILKQLTGTVLMLLVLNSLVKIYLYTVLMYP